MEKKLKEGVAELPSIQMMDNVYQPYLVLIESSKAFSIQYEDSCGDILMDTYMCDTKAGAIKAAQSKISNYLEDQKRLIGNQIQDLINSGLIASFTTQSVDVGDTTSTKLVFYDNHGFQKGDRVVAWDDCTPSNFSIGTFQRATKKGYIVEVEDSEDYYTFCIHAQDFRLDKILNLEYVY